MPLAAFELYALLGGHAGGKQLGNVLYIYNV